MNSKGRSTGKYSSKFFQLVVWLLIWTFFLPAPMSGLAASADMEPWNRHVHERLNSPERARVLEEAARIEAEARAQFERGEATAQRPAAMPKSSPTVQAPDATTVAQDKSRNTESFRPKTVTEVLFNYGASFAGVPGLTPQRGVDGYDEGLGFHQDGTVRRAGGTASASGPSDRGQRARSYMQSGFQTGHGLGYGGRNDAGLDPNSLYGEMHYNLWGRDDSTRGGKVSGQNGYSRDLGDFDPMNMALDRGLSYGAGLLNSAGEAAISGLVDGGRARLNFYMDKDGYFGGEGDALLPWYDSQYTTVFTQLGARSMHDESDTRWIGNFGLGQRWFPAATEEDAGNWMVGYNAFFDYDFTRDHQRGGVGVEAQYDWLRFASNYYFPLSNWKGSEDFDSDFVKERPAKGWDMRVKGYLPFYRNVAITGSYSQWYGDHVGMFGASNLEKDPRVWSYGVEYTPIPLVSGFITQKSTERGRTDTEFGMNFTYHFQMPWEDQISHAKVAELRTVSGSRHEFVDRENRIILEYKAKNAFRIEYLGRVGTNTFKFRIMDGFGKYKAGQTVRVSAGGGVTLAEAPAAPKSFLAQAGEALADFFSVSTAHAADFSQTYTTDGNGEFTVRLDDVAALPVTVTIQAGSNTQSFTLTEATLSSGLSASPSSIKAGETSTLTFTGKGAAFASVNVDWVVVSGPGNFGGNPTESTTTDGSGGSTIVLTATDTSDDNIVVKATVNGKEYTCTVLNGVAYTLVAQTPTDGAAFASGSTTATAKMQLQRNGAAYTTQTQVTWSIVSANNSNNEAVVSSYATKATGLAWGSSATSTPGTALSTTTTSNTDASGNAEIDLTDIMGERTVKVRASVTIGGQTVTEDQTLSFGAGPLSKFRLPADPGGAAGSALWADNDNISLATNLPAAGLCGKAPTGFTTWSTGDYTSQTGLPKRTDLEAVALGNGNGAAEAAGWKTTTAMASYYWTGELYSDGTNVYAYTTQIDSGNHYTDWLASGNYYSVVCSRP